MASILIVDDRPTNRQFLLTLLGYTGHRLLEAADGAQALELVRAERPDLVITDILMPNMDGFEFVQKLRADPELAGAPVIFYSATYSVDDARKLAKACGVEIVLPKPSEPEAIFAAVNRMLGTVERLPVVPAPASGAADIRQLGKIGEMLVDYTDDLQAIRQAIEGVAQRGANLAAESERLRQMTRRFSDNLTSLQRVTARLTALEEMLLRMMAERRPQALVEKFLGAAIRIVGSKYAAIAILDEAEHDVVLLHAREMDAELLRPAALERASLPGSLLDAREPRLEFSATGGVQGLPPGHPAVRSFLGLQIATSERVIGWVYFADKLGADEFNDEDARIAATMASQLAVRYENVSLYHLIQRHAAQLQLEVSERRRAETEVRDLNANLEQRVAQRTDELTAANRELKDTQAQLVQSAKMASLGELTAGIAHEVNNPLAFVMNHLGTVEWALQAAAADAGRTPSADAAKKHATAFERFAEMRNGLERIGDLVLKLRTFSRLDQGERAIVDVEESIESVIILLQYRLRDRIQVKRSYGKVKMLPCYPGPLNQVLMNLLSNAIDAIDAAGGEGEIAIATKKDGPMFVISVSDTGSGIPDAVRERIFEPFFTTKPVGQGTGLGLSISYGIIREHGGEMEARSIEGKGTQMIVKIPLDPGRETSEGRRA